MVLSEDLAVEPIAEQKVVERMAPGLLVEELLIELLVESTVEPTVELVVELVVELAECLADLINHTGD